MNISAKIIADSTNTATGDRLTTMLVRMPRCIQAELNTHRTMSKSSASSRAIPTAKFRELVNADPYQPDEWLSATKGMAAGGSISAADAKEVSETWRSARLIMDQCHRKLETFGLAKQISNRLLEPWMYTEVLVSATEWQNFFALRCNAQADPAIQAVADRMLCAYCGSAPQQLQPGEWHLPFSGEWPKEVMEPGLREEITEKWKIMVCVARAARTSYFGFEGENSLDKDLALYQRLSDSGHWSPFEHVAQAVHAPDTVLDFSAQPKVRIGNFTGWRQHRYDFAQQVRRCDLRRLLAERQLVSEYAKEAL